MPIFLAWFMIGILPFYMFREGVEMAQKFGKKRGWEISAWEVLLGILIILFIVLWMAGYRL